MCSFQRCARSNVCVGDAERKPCRLYPLDSVAIADLTQGLWQGGRGMRIMTVAFALGTALVLCNLGTFNAAAHAQKAKVVREPRERPIIRVPVVRTTPYWDYYIVPRYRYRPEDDRVDPCGGPVVPV